MGGNNGQISVFPTPSSTSDAFKVYYVNNDPEDKGGNNLLHSHSDIKYFADDKVYLVVIYAGIKVLQTSLGETDISTFNSSPSIPVPSLDINQFETFLETNEDAELAQLQLGRLNNELSRYQADIQKYQAEYGKDIQSYQQEVAEKSAEYQWKAQRLVDLKTEYMQAFNIKEPAKKKIKEEHYGRSRPRKYISSNFYGRYTFKYGRYLQL